MKKIILFSLGIATILAVSTMNFSINTSMAIPQNPNPNMMLKQMNQTGMMGPMMGMGGQQWPMMGMGPMMGMEDNNGL